MPKVRFKNERYPYRFLEIDDSEINYYNFLQDIKKQFKNDSAFDYKYDEDYFFNTVKKFLNESTVRSSYGFEILCHFYGVNGYQKL